MEIDLRNSFNNKQDPNQAGTLPEGTLLKKGKFKIKRFLASGGFGFTYEAEHTLLGKRFAIKEFFPKSFCLRASDSKGMLIALSSQEPLINKLKKKFIEEAQAIATFNHEGIIKVSDVFIENGTAYYVMDYINGKSLNDILKEKGRLSEQETWRYLGQVCEALDYVHQQNRLHLDIKPANIMICEDGKAILIDFGTSKQYDEVNGENSSSIVPRTIGYAPLEQMGNDKSRLKPATDIYALGATIYKCLTGITPISANELVQGYELDPLPNGVSEGTKRLIKAAMIQKSIERSQSVMELLAVLNQPSYSKPAFASPNEEDSDMTEYESPVLSPKVGRQFSGTPKVSATPKFSETPDRPRVQETRKVPRDPRIPEPPKVPKDDRNNVNKGGSDWGFEDMPVFPSGGNQFYGESDNLDRRNSPNTPQERNGNRAFSGYKDYSGSNVSSSRNHIPSPQELFTGSTWESASSGRERDYKRGNSLGRGNQSRSWNSLNFNNKPVALEFPQMDIRIPLTAGSIIGRTTGPYHRQLEKCLYISGTHARIDYDGSQWTITDLGSRNGTKVNGVRCNPTQPLKVGDIVRLGNYYDFKVV